MFLEDTKSLKHKVFQNYSRSHKIIERKKCFRINYKTINITEKNITSQNQF